MKRTSGSCPRVPARAGRQSSQSFNSRLKMYSVAAGAAGVGVLALAPPTQAEIAYTPTDVTITASRLHNYPLDLNNDGTPDFFIDATAHQSSHRSGVTSIIMVKPAVGNGAAGYAGGSALALMAGQRIGSGRKFVGRLMATVFTFSESVVRYGGPWTKVKNRYLGLQFQIDGQTHYGWARLSVGGETLEAKLTGYAYETTPNTPIVAGKTSGTDRASATKGGAPFESPANATLAALALGALALPFWRRQEMEAVAGRSVRSHE
jgi:hypothetical protein